MRDPSGDSFHWPVLPLRTRPSGGSLGRPCPRRRGVLIEYSLPLSSYLRVMVVFISRLSHSYSQGLDTHRHLAMTLTVLTPSKS
ncbi:hypothetical protein PO909_027372 [Leuciscus waleckii]